MQIAELAVEERESRAQGPWARAVRRFVHKKVAMASLITILLIYFAGIFAPVVAPYSYTQQNLDQALARPSLQHFFGTDRLGRDIFSRIVWGARTAAFVSVAAVSLSFLFGIIIGGLTGYLGGKVDMFFMRLGELFMAFPSLLLVILIASTVRPRVIDAMRHFEDTTHITGIVRGGYVDYLVIFGALSFLGWVGLARLIRGQILSLKEAQFVEAARAAGATDWRIIKTHLLPNVMGPVLVTLSMALGGAVGSEVVLSWLGIGVQPPNPSWGQMIFDNQAQLRVNPHLLLTAAMPVFVVFLAFNLLGDGLNDALNPRSQ